jgi:hypothetical protein
MFGISKYISKTSVYFNDVYALVLYENYIKLYQKIMLAEVVITSILTGKQQNWIRYQILLWIRNTKFNRNKSKSED